MDKTIFDKTLDTLNRCAAEIHARIAEYDKEGVSFSRGEYVLNCAAELVSTLAAQDVKLTQAEIVAHYYEKRVEFLSGK
jgi:hypothetical protein